MATKLKKQKTFDVGGLNYDRPFRIRRLGHFGFNVRDMPAALHFYSDLLGFSISDPLDFGHRVENPEERKALGDTVGYFMRHGTDHHSFVVFPKRILDKFAGRPETSDMTVNQITWQVGSLREVVDATAWFKENAIHFNRSGRDTPGSNWHVYPVDPEGHTNELYYGIEQIGWDGKSKPKEIFDQQYREAPTLPQRSEFQEIEDALARQVDIGSGYRFKSEAAATYDVGGVLLPRPFKVSRIGPVRLFVNDMEVALSFYRDRLGLTVSEEVTWQGHRCVFLRAGTEHHSVGLYPKVLREDLGLSTNSSCMAFGMQVAEYAQLRDAVAFMKKNDVTIKFLPPELFPGIDYSAFAIDPEGHAIQLYYYMEQVGWDGQPRPSAQRPKVDNGNWPASLDPLPDSYAGETFMGPWG